MGSLTTLLTTKKDKKIATNCTAKNTDNTATNKLFFSHHEGIGNVKKYKIYQYK